MDWDVQELVPLTALMEPKLTLNKAVPNVDVGVLQIPVM